MYYYVNILLTKNALNTFISNENNFVQNQLLRSADSISFSFIPVAYSALLCWSPALEVCTGSKLKPEPGPYPRLSDPTRPDPSGTVKFRARTRPEIPPPNE